MDAGADGDGDSATLSGSVWAGVVMEGLSGPWGSGADGAEFPAGGDERDEGGVVGDKHGAFSDGKCAVSGEKMRKVPQAARALRRLDLVKVPWSLRDLTCHPCLVSEATNEGCRVLILMSG